MVWRSRGCLVTIHEWCIIMVQGLVLSTGALDVLVEEDFIKVGLVVVLILRLCLCVWFAARSPSCISDRALCVWAGGGGCTQPCCDT